MILTCPKCSTRYDIDTGSIPAEGTYAHCATCENIFFIKRKSKTAISSKTNFATPAIDQEIPVTAKTTTPPTQSVSEPQPVEDVAPIAPQDTEETEKIPVTEAPLAIPVMQSKAIGKRDKPAKQKAELKAEDIEAILKGVNVEESLSSAESTTLTGQDEIDNILGDIKTEIKEKRQAAPQKEIEDILGSILPTPPKDERESNVSASADDIEAILASVQAQKPAEAPKPKAPAPQSASAEDIDAILASVQAQKPAEAPKPKAPAPQSASADDIEAILASVQAQKPAEAPKPKAPEPQSASAEDIDAIFASVQAQKAPSVPPPPMSTESQADINDIFSGMGEASAPPSSAAHKELDDILSSAAPQEAPGAGFAEMDDIDAILAAAHSPEPRESILEREAGGTQALSNNEIENLLGPSEPPAPAPAADMGPSQDDIDSLLGAARQPEKPAPAAAKAPTDDIISQDDLDSLFETARTAAPAKSGDDSKGSDLISQDELDKLLGETKPAPRPALAAAGNDIVSQDDLDAILSGAGVPQAESAPATASSGSVDDLLSGSDNELESLFASEASTGIKTPAASPSAAATAQAAAPAEGGFEGVDTSMFEGLDKELSDTHSAPQASAEPAEAAAEAKPKGPGMGAKIIAFIKTKLPKRAGKPVEFQVEESAPGESAPAKKRRFAKVALPIAAGLALVLGAGIFYLHKQGKTDALLAMVGVHKKKPDTLAKAEIPKAPETAPEHAKTEEAKPAAPEKGHEPEKAPQAKTDEPKPAPTPAEPEKKSPAPEEKKAAPEKPATPAHKEAEKPPVVAEADHSLAMREAMKAEELIPKSMQDPTVMSVGVMLPVDLNASQVKMMTADVELQFATGSEFKSATTKKFLYELALENEIETFFRDKFYEETHYVKDKLMAYLFERFKKRSDMDKVVGVNIQTLTLR